VPLTDLSLAADYHHGIGVGSARSVISSGDAAERLTLAIAEHSASQSWFEQHDGPTLLVAAAIYTSWLSLLASYVYVPWWITAPLAGYVVQWHFSLQHEAIHGMRGLPRWLRRALVWPPLGIWFPFELYRRSHSQHHRNSYLTYPGEDTESYYHEEEDWEDYGDLWKWLLIVNQTFLGRLFLGPLLRTPRLFIKEVGKMAAGDTANVGIWARHFVGLALMLLLVTKVIDISVVQYLVVFVYPGLVFGMMRGFTEHRWANGPANARRWSSRIGCSDCCSCGITFTWFITSSRRCRGGRYLGYGGNIVSASRRITMASYFEVTARSRDDGS
jgi:fatty acid desaturase